MEVILKEDVPKLGNRGEVVKVAEGYGRNFLLPKKMAIEATEANKTVIEQMKAAAVRRSAKEKTEAEALAKQFDGLEVKFLRKSGEARSVVRIGHGRRYCRGAREEELPHRSAEDPVARAAQDHRRVHRPHQAAQGRDHALEGSCR